MAASNQASRAWGAGTNTTDVSAPVAAQTLGHRVEHGQPVLFAAALARRDAADPVRAGRLHPGSVEGAFSRPVMPCTITRVAVSTMTAMLCPVRPAGRGGRGQAARARPCRHSRRRPHAPRHRPRRRRRVALASSTASVGAQPSSALLPVQTDHDRQLGTGRLQPHRAGPTPAWSTRVRPPKLLTGAARARVSSSRTPARGAEFSAPARPRPSRGPRPAGRRRRRSSQACSWPGRRRCPARPRPPSSDTYRTPASAAANSRARPQRRASSPASPGGRRRGVVVQVHLQHLLQGIRLPAQNEPAG